MKIVSDEKEVAIDAIPLATKPPSIVDWKIHKEGKKNYTRINQDRWNVQRLLSTTVICSKALTGKILKLYGKSGRINKITECWIGSYMTPVEFIP
ncbi:hypothetical protein Tco_0453709 [Tanacetum coccineum]